MMDDRVSGLLEFLEVEEKRGHLCNSLIEDLFTVLPVPCCAVQYS